MAGPGREEEEDGRVRDRAPTQDQDGMAGWGWLLHPGVWLDTGLRGTPARPLRQAQDRLTTNGFTGGLDRKRPV